MTECGNCGCNLSDNIKFCTLCGTEVRKTSNVGCGSCNAANPQGVKYCIFCGRALGSFRMDSPETPMFIGPSLSHIQGNANPVPYSSVWPYYRTGSSAANFNTFDTNYARPGKKPGKAWAVLAVTSIVLVCFIVFIFRGNISSLIRGTDDKEGAYDDAGIEGGTAELNPAPMPLSGSKELKVSPAPGLTIFAEANALDKDREFKASLVDESELQDIANSFPYGDMIVIDAYMVDAGLEQGEFFPGMVRLEFDMDKLDIPKSMMAYMGAVRIGSDGQTEILSSSVEGSKLICLTNKNSVIVTTLLFGGLAAVSGYFIYDDLGEKNLWKFSQYKGKKFYKTDLLPGYSIFWPEGMGHYNPGAVREKIDEFNKVLAKHNITTDMNIAGGIIQAGGNTNYKNYREAVRTIFGKVFNDKDFARLFEEVSSVQWQEENAWPMEVKVSLEALKNADKYLFDVRKFRRPGHVVEVGILSEWPYDDKHVAGYSFNPKLGSPYFHINADYPGIPWLKEQLENPKFRERYQRGLDELNITIVHELFHVVQSGYVPVDWSSYIWFWEATAVLLENEAAEYYLNKNIIKNVDSTTERNYFETFANTLGYPKQWTRMHNHEGLIRNQGYTASWFLQFLRDRYYSNRKDEFLNKLITRFGYHKDYAKALREQTSNSEVVFRADFRLFCAENGEKIRNRVSSVAKDSNAPFFDLTTPGSYYRLDEKKPYNEIVTEYTPFSTNVKFLDINYDSNRLAEKDVFLVFKTSEDDMQKSEDMLIRFDQSEGRDFKSISKGNAYKVENIKNLSGNIQEVHSYMEVSGNNSEKKYYVFMMLKPEKPGIEVKENKLAIKLPQKSPLFGAGFVDKYLVTIKDPKGQIIMLETDKTSLELELNSTGDFMDWDSPEMKKVIVAALRKYLDSNPQLEEELYGKGGNDVADKALDFIGDLEIDYGVLERAAEVINEAMTGSQVQKKYSVTISEMTKDEKPVYGPASDLAELEVKTSNTDGINIYGTWEGKVQITNQRVTAVIEQGKDGYDYTMKLSMYEGIEFYGMDNGDGTCTFDGVIGFSIIKISEKELYMTAPPITFTRK